MRIGSVLTHAGEALLEGLLIALLVVGVIAGTAFAAGKGGGGGGGGGGHNKPGGQMTATVTVSPNPVPANSSFSVGGCGYTPNAGVQLNLYAPGITSVWGATADASGCLTNIRGWAGAAGKAKLNVLQGSVTLVASTSFMIQ